MQVLKYQLVVVAHGMGPIELFLFLSALFGKIKVPTASSRLDWDV
jgi:hypothetical protein